MDEHNLRFIGEYQLDNLLTPNDAIYSDCEVFEATQKETKRKVILKLGREANNGTREMEIHMSISHESIVKLLESFKTRCLRNVMVFEKYDCDLQELYTSQTIESNRIQKFMKQLMEGLQYIHGKNIIHRDIKPENLLIDKNDCLKIGDFGLARFSDPAIKMTPDSVSLWYRSIEILLDCTNHSSAVDIWSAGCVMAELYRRYPLFRGEGQINMINKIISVLGKPTLNEWPTMNELPSMAYVELDGPPSSRFEDAIPTASEKSLDLIRKMIKFDPTRRLTAAQVLQHDYFCSDDTSASNTNNDNPDFP